MNGKPERLESLHAAARELRKRLQLSQTEMGQQILDGRSLGAVQDYEGGGKPPAKDALAAYVILAARNGYHDLAAIFRKALDDDYPTVVLDAINYTPQAGVQNNVKVIGHVAMSVPKSVEPILRFVIEILDKPLDRLEAAIARQIREAMKDRETAAGESRNDKRVNGS